MQNLLQATMNQRFIIACCNQSVYVQGCIQKPHELGVVNLRLKSPKEYEERILKWKNRNVWFRNHPSGSIN
jgi:hypothetical protein